MYNVSMNKDIIYILLITLVVYTAHYLGDIYCSLPW